MKCPECGSDQIKYFDVLNKGGGIKKNLHCPQCNIPIGTHSFIWLIFASSFALPSLLFVYLPDCHFLLVDNLFIYSIVLGTFISYFLLWALPLLNKSKKFYKTQEVIFWFIIIFCLLFGFGGYKYF